MTYFASEHIGLTGVMPAMHDTSRRGVSLTIPYYLNVCNYMPTTLISMLKLKGCLSLLGRSLTLAALGWVSSTGLLAQTGTAATSSGSVNTGVMAAPATLSSSTITTDTPLLQATARTDADQAAFNTPETDAGPSRPMQRIAGPNQFQRFVQETTGRLLPI